MVQLLTLETFNNRFYKNLDDNVLCGDMSDSDTIVCFELPCNARQSRLYKKRKTDPFILPVFLTDVQTARHSYGHRNQSNFGHPFIVVIDVEQARSAQAIYDAVVDRLQRWTGHVRDLFTWQETPSVSVDSVPIPVPPTDSLTEIKENGEVVRVEDTNVDESDIADEKAVIRDDVMMDDTTIDGVPQIVGITKDIFALRLQAGQIYYGAGFSTYTSGHRFDSWDTRLEEMDALYCEFDENLRTYNFGDDTSHWEHATWTNSGWATFVHPEYTEAKKT